MLFIREVRTHNYPDILGGRDIHIACDEVPLQSRIHDIYVSKGTRKSASCPCALGGSFNDKQKSVYFLLVPQIGNRKHQGFRSGIFVSAQLFHGAFFFCIATNDKTSQVFTGLT